MKKLILQLVICLLTIGSVSATVHIVQSDNFFYSPDFLTVDPGDTIRFQWVVGNHPTSSTSGPWGAGVSFPQNSADPTHDLVLTTPGTYDYICDFHVGLGMFGTIVVNSAAPCSSPPASMTAVFSGPTVDLSWAAVPGSIGCEISGGVVGSGFPASKRVTGIEPTSYTIPSSFLPFGDYEARVRCACSISPLVVTGYSPIATFLVPPHRLGNDLNEFSDILSPNPASQFVTIQFALANNAEVKIEILNILGAVIQVETYDATEGEQLRSIDLSHIENGHYFVSLSTEGAVRVLPFAKNN